MALSVMKGRSVLLAWSAAGFAVLATGLALWTARADAVFLDMLSSALAWCM